MNQQGVLVQHRRQNRVEGVGRDRRQHRADGLAGTIRRHQDRHLLVGQAALGRLAAPLAGLAIRLGGFAFLGPLPGLIALAASALT